MRVQQKGTDMTLNQLIGRRKASIARNGGKPGKARVYWHGYDVGGRRKFEIVIPTGKEYRYVHITGTCAFDESDVRGTESFETTPETFGVTA